ncbi:MAG: hypothetical protein ACR2JI_13010 [Mycobacterium sp.]
MNELIEKYLRTRGVRYFRGHRDDEYFYLVDTRILTGHARLHVHLAVCGAERDAVQISITGDRYYPAGHSEVFQQAVSRWNDECHDVGAVIQPSCDPALVGVVAGSRYRGTDVGQLSTFVEGAEAGAVQLLGLIGDLVAPLPPTLRNAG